MTKEEFQEIIVAVCPRCREGNAVRRRDDTGEHVHDGPHGICWANGFRNSRFAEVMKDG